MNLRATLLAMAAGLFLFVGACGGGSDSDGNSSGGSGNSTTDTGNSGSTGSSSTCAPPIQTSVVGGDLFVAEQAPVGMTLLSDGGLNQYTLAFFYNNVFGIPTNNQQDKWGAATPLPFPPGT